MDARSYFQGRLPLLMAALIIGFIGGIVVDQVRWSSPSSDMTARCHAWTRFNTARWGFKKVAFVVTKSEQDELLAGVEATRCLNDFGITAEVVDIDDIHNRDGSGYTGKEQEFSLLVHVHSWRDRDGYAAPFTVQSLSVRDGDAMSPWDILGPSYLDYASFATPADAGAQIAMEIASRFQSLEDIFSRARP
jgi:hypothetical protein